MSNGNQNDKRNTAGASGRPVCYTVYDADFTVPADSGPGAYVVYATLTAARVINLPPIADVPPGWEATVKDLSGNCDGTKTLTLNGDGAEAIDSDSSLAIQIAFGFAAVRRTGPLGTLLAMADFAWGSVSQKLT